MLFYPSHDIALSNGVKHFNPPAAALRLQEDLASLADIWNEGRQASGLMPLPWGWDWDTRRSLQKDFGIKPESLPSDDELETIRQLSNRRVTIDILSDLSEPGIEIPQYIDDEKIIRQFIDQHDCDGIPFALKTPWSSSGRGLTRSRVTPREVMMRHGAATIRRMGGIMGERWYDKRQDFAMLFYIGHDEVRHIGYSLFDNDEAGTYRAGYLMSNEAIVGHICRSSKVVTSGKLEDLAHRLTTILTRLMAPLMHQPWEVGYAGIDMMTFDADGKLHPCIELNLRCTMGVVARLYHDRHMRPDEVGQFLISPLGEDGHFHAEFKRG